MIVSLERLSCEKAELTDMKIHVTRIEVFMNLSFHKYKSSGVKYDANSLEEFYDFSEVIYKNPEYCKAFGNHLRKLREEKGIGIREFARISDIEYSQLSKIERGVTNPTISTIYGISLALGISHSELYNFKFPIKENV